MLQADKPDVIVGIPFFACTSLLAVKLGVPYISLIPTGLMGNSHMHPLWRGSGRNFHVSPRLASVPDLRFVARHPMVRPAVCACNSISSLSNSGCVSVRKAKIQGFPLPFIHARFIRAVRVKQVKARRSPVAGVG